MRWLRGLAGGLVVVALTLALVFAFSGSSPLPVLTPQRYRVGPGPTSAAFDDKGVLWVTYNDGVARIDTKEVLSKLPLSCCISFGFGGAATGPDGDIWFNDGEDIGTVGASGKPRFVFLSERVGLPNAMTTGPDASLWYTDESGPAAAIGRITPSGVVTLFRIPTPSLAGWTLAGIVTGSDGALWFTETPFDGGVESIGRMTIDGRFSHFVLPDTGVSPRESGAAFEGSGLITAGSDGALWLTEPQTNRIGRITTAGKVTEYRVPANGDPRGPYGIAAGRDGALWFATDTHFGRITTSGRITLWRVAGAEAMTDVVAAHNGTFWVPDERANVVFHITPPT